MLRAVGFEDAAGDDGGPALSLKRDDPGLLWLGKSALEEHAAHARLPTGAVLCSRSNRRVGDVPPPRPAGAEA